MNSIYIGTRNVMTVLKPGKMQELAEQTAHTQLEIFAIKKKSGNGLIKRSNYSLYYSGSNTTGQAGNGFIVTKKALKYTLGSEPYNERICGLFKKYPTFGREKYIYTPRGLQP
jgi:hypothetical protein